MSCTGCWSEASSWPGRSQAAEVSRGSGPGIQDSRVAWSSWLPLWGRGEFCPVLLQFCPVPQHGEPTLFPGITACSTARTGIHPPCLVSLGLAALCMGPCLLGWEEDSTSTMSVAGFPISSQGCLCPEAGVVLSHGCSRTGVVPSVPWGCRSRSRSQWHGGKKPQHLVYSRTPLLGPAPPTQQHPKHGWVGKAKNHPYPPVRIPWPPRCPFARRSSFSVIVWHIQPFRFPG